MKNNRGFTLVELLAVIIVLATISLVTVTSISTSLYNREEKECNEQIELALNAAKIYFSFKTGESRVQISNLIKDGYFDGDNKISKLNKGLYVTKKSSGYYISDKNGSKIDKNEDICTE